MPLQQTVIDCVNKWSGTTVQLLSDLLCDLWLKGGHTACDDIAFEDLLQRIRDGFPNRRITLMPGDLSPDRGSVKSVRNLVDRVAASQEVES